MENQVVFILMPLFMGIAGYHLFQYIKNGRTKIGKAENYIFYAVIGILVVWGIARNLI